MCCAVFVRLRRVFGNAGCANDGCGRQELANAGHCATKRDDAPQHDDGDSSLLVLESLPRFCICMDMGFAPENWNGVFWGTTKAGPRRDEPRTQQIGSYISSRMASIGGVLSTRFV